jgi:DNA-binding response OmpR family regulator
MAARPLLLVDPNTAAAARLAAAISAHGFRLESESAPERLLLRVAERRHALVLMRGGTAPPHWSAVEALRQLRAASSIPCILLAGTADAADDRVAALEAGADDYLHPGMATVEAVARIRAVLRRSGPGPAAQHGVPAPEAAAPDVAAPRVWRLVPEDRCILAPDGAVHRLTGAEFELLRLLTAAAGEPVDREVICRQVFRHPWRPEDRSVDDLVKRLRRKTDPLAIQAVWGVCYAMPRRRAPVACVENCGAA